MQTFKHILRRMTRNPGFTTIALVTDVGHWGDHGCFSVVEGVLIKPLPYPDADRLVGVWHVAPGIPSLGGRVNCAPTMDFTVGELNQTFEAFGLWSGGGVSVTDAAEPEQVKVFFMTDGVLDALGVQPALGRWFSKADAQPDAAGTVILTYGYWQRRFGRDPQSSAEA